MTPEELKSYIKQAEAGGGTAKLSKLLHDVKAGIVKADEIHAYYDAQYRPIVLAKLVQFGKGDLFACQREGFSAFLSGKSYHADFDRYLALRADVEMLNRENRKSANGAMLFAALRILKPGNSFNRNETGKKHGIEVLRQKWVSVNQRYGWTWAQQNT